MLKSLTEAQLKTARDTLAKITIIRDPDYKTNPAINSFIAFHEFIKNDVLKPQERSTRGRKTEVDINSIIVYDVTSRALIFTYNSYTLNLGVIKNGVCPKCDLPIANRGKYSPIEKMFGYHVKMCVRCADNMSYLVLFFKKSEIYDRIRRILTAPNHELIDALNAIYKGTDSESVEAESISKKRSFSDVYNSSILKALSERVRDINITHVPPDAVIDGTEPNNMQVLIESQTQQKKPKRNSAKKQPKPQPSTAEELLDIAIKKQKKIVTQWFSSVVGTTINKIRVATCAGQGSADMKRIETNFANTKEFENLKKIRDQAMDSLKKRKLINVEQFIHYSHNISIPVVLPTTPEKPTYTDWMLQPDIEALSLQAQMDSLCEALGMDKDVDIGPFPNLVLGDSTSIFSEEMGSNVHQIVSNQNPDQLYYQQQSPLLPLSDLDVDDMLQSDWENPTFQNSFELNTIPSEQTKHDIANIDNPNAFPDIYKSDINSINIMQQDIKPISQPLTEIQRNGILDMISTFNDFIGNYEIPDGEDYEIRFIGVTNKETSLHSKATKKQRTQHATVPQAKKSEPEFSNDVEEVLAQGSIETELPKPPEIKQNLQVQQGEQTPIQDQKSKSTLDFFNNLYEDYDFDT